ncbi:MAG: hypothetical protein FJ265_15885 [Planctomycetes bacterium]|nr:hypothetical protein [Planctomycetota bacterium]
MPRFLATTCAVLLVLSAACDNVGRAFDPIVEPPGPNPTTTTSAVQVVRAGGDLREGRPKVKAVFPVGGGWPGTVPIVVEFSESLNEDSMLPTSASSNDAKVAVRVVGSQAAIPASYDFLAAGRILVVRPSTGLSNQQNPTYEIVLLPGGRDADGVRFDVPADGKVLAEFQVNQDGSFTDGRILTTFPRDNQRDGPRETAYYVFFDRPANLTTVTATNLFLRPAGGTALVGTTEPPLALLGNDDPRIVRFTPTAPFAASTDHELVVDDTIKFGASGKLDFRGRTPYARFRTVGPQAPTTVHVGNPAAGFDDKINRSNLANCVLHVATTNDAAAGDTVLARIYGGDRNTAATGDLRFVERSAVLGAGGAQTVVVDFGGALGTLERPLLDDGAVWFAVQLQRGAEHSGFALSRAADAPMFDATAPALLRLGPPSAANGTDVYADQESLALYGTASERIGTASLVVGGSPAVELFTAANDGRFLLKPVSLGRLTAPVGYSLAITDLAGNSAAAPATGNVHQRGVVKLEGPFAGTLAVVAYDQTTLAPVAGATVLVDTDVPTVPATAQVVGTTDAAGSATFLGLGGSSRTVTVVRAGYHLVTLYGTGASYVSLPLRPLADATASFTGSAVFQAGPGASALVGNNTFDDPLVLAVPTTTAAPTTIPATPIQPNRPQVITAFAGAFEPTATPAYTHQGVQMLAGAAVAVLAPPAAPAAAGGTSTQNVALLSATGALVANLTTSTEDFALATGLDTGNLVGGRPTVRAMLSLAGFGGQVLAGVGAATPATGAAWSMQATWAAPVLAGFTPLTPFVWVATEARDVAGRVSRHRGLYLFSIFVDPVNPPGIPAVAAPAAAFAGSPAVTFDDQLDPSGVPGGIAFAEVTARDGNGRLWQLLVADADAVGGTEAVQFPDLATANVAGLAAGTWSVRAEGRVAYPVGGMTLTDCVLAERLRQEVTYARSAPVSFTVQ